MSESQTPSLPSGLCNRALDVIVDRNGLAEVGAPYMVLTSPMSPDPVGQVRIFGPGQGTSSPVAKVVYVGLTVPMIGLDSHMVFAFGGGDVPVPHFTLDSVQGQGTFAFHLDLIQRAELASHLTYLDWAHEPLTETYEKHIAMPGLSKAAIGPRQFAMMSPWMLASRADEAAFVAIEDAVKVYLDHWFALLEAPVPAEVLDDVSDTDLVARDLRNRAHLFSAEVDPVWDQVAQLIGPEASEAVRVCLIDNSLPAEAPAEVLA